MSHIFAVVSLLISLSFLASCATQPVEHSIVDPKRAAEFNAKLGLGYMQQGRYDVALQKLQKSKQQDPDNYLVYHYLATLYQQLDEEDKADEYFRLAIELNPENSAVQNNYGVFLCDKGQYKQAQRHFAKALSDPVYTTKDQTHENLGLCAQLGGDIRTAEKHLRTALKLNPKLVKGLLAMAEIRFDTREYTSASGFYQRYLEIALQTPKSLWLGILLERQLGNRNSEASYSVLLKNKYPDSKEARLLEKLQGSRGR